MKHAITTIAFDYGGVLVNMINDTVICHMADSIGVGVERFRASLWKFRHDFDAGTLDAETYWQHVCEYAGMSWPTDPSHRREVVETLMHLDTIAYLTVNPGILRWIKTLRSAQYRCIMISNMSSETYDMVVKGSLLEQHFERVILYGWLKINKPHKEIFLEAVRQLNVSPHEILFLDDLSHNVEGARKVGFNALQFTDTETLYRMLEEQFSDIPRKGLVCER